MMIISVCLIYWNTARRDILFVFLLRRNKFSSYVFSVSHDSMNRESKKISTGAAEDDTSFAPVDFVAGRAPPGGILLGVRL